MIVNVWGDVPLKTGSMYEPDIMTESAMRMIAIRANIENFAREEISLTDDIGRMMR
jgi:hypothetical protein